MDFWDTVRGHRLADVITIAMPKMVDELKKLNENLENLANTKEKEN
ncbi:hypothetical protein [Clostridium sp.]|nr:hypothetical protein [Clostridium sp.]MBP3916021.1 hypothetical protein [Clostridium sp.]